MVLGTVGSLVLSDILTDAARRLRSTRQRSLSYAYPVTPGSLSALW